VQADASKDLSVELENDFYQFAESRDWGKGRMNHAEVPRPAFKVSTLTAARGSSVAKYATTWLP
jgi:hypothetical protein